MLGAVKDALIDSVVGAVDMICAVSASADGAPAVSAALSASASGVVLVTLLRISSALTPLVTISGRMIVKGAKPPLAPPGLVPVAERLSKPKPTMDLSCT